jgi:UDP-glucuronate decarboxylase
MINNIKQLHKQSTTNQNKHEETMPTHHHHHQTLKSLKHKTFSRSINYIFKEQRLLFIIIGISVGALFFAYQPILSSIYNNAYNNHNVHNNEDVQSMRVISFAQRRPVRIPVGIGRKRMRVVVTGGSGFVGSHLVDKLMERGDEVIVIDNFFTGRKENVAHHLDNPRFELIRHDVVNPILLEVDMIYHLACPASPVHYKYNPIKTIISFLVFEFVVVFWTCRCLALHFESDDVIIYVSKHSGKFCLLGTSV